MAALQLPAVALWPIHLLALELHSPELLANARTVSSSCGPAAGEGTAVCPPPRGPCPAGRCAFPRQQPVCASSPLTISVPRALGGILHNQCNEGQFLHLGLSLKPSHRGLE